MTRSGLKKAEVKCISTNSNMPDFSGFNRSLAREHCQSAEPATHAIYTSLRDTTPSDPDTIITARAEEQKRTGGREQKFKIFANDQQLYKVININISMWFYPEQFNLFMFRLEGCTC